MTVFSPEREGLTGHFIMNIDIRFFGRTQDYIEDITRWREDMNDIFEKMKFISSRRRVMFFLLYRQKDIDKMIEGNDRNYVIDKLT